MRFLCLQLLLLTLIASFAAAEDDKKLETYLCIADKATGFNFNESSGKWEAINFTVEGRRHLIRPSRPDDLAYDSIAYVGHQFGEDDISIVCEKEPDEMGWLHCGHFVMNTATKRYIIRGNGGYVSATIDIGGVFRAICDNDMFETDPDCAGIRGHKDDFTVPLKDDKGGDSEYLEIGKCSPL